jgi:hypothetical protein
MNLSATEYALAREATKRRSTGNGDHPQWIRFRPGCTEGPETLSARTQKPTVTVYHPSILEEKNLNFVVPSKTLAKTPSKSIFDLKNEENPLSAHADRIAERLDSLTKGTQRVPFPCEYRNRQVHPISSNVTKSILLRAGITRWSRVAIFACPARLNTHLHCLRRSPKQMLRWLMCNSPADAPSVIADTCSANCKYADRQIRLTIDNCG